MNRTYRYAFKRHLFGHYTLTMEFTCSKINFRLMITQCFENIKLYYVNDAKINTVTVIVWGQYIIYCIKKRLSTSTPLVDSPCREGEVSGKLTSWDFILRSVAGY